MSEKRRDSKNRILCSGESQRKDGRYAYKYIDATGTKSSINPKALQYLMGHSDIGVTLNTYTRLGFEDAQEELKRVANGE